VGVVSGWFSQPSLLGAIMLLLILAFRYLVVRAVLNSKDENVHARFGWSGFSIRKGREADREKRSPSGGDEADEEVGEPSG
jgi:hypothetical protein